MPVYECKSCLYSTDVKSNYNKHIRTKKHVIHTQSQIKIKNTKSVVREVLSSVVHVVQPTIPTISNVSNVSKVASKKYIHVLIVI